MAVSIERLHQIAVDNQISGAEMAEEAGRFARLASRHDDGTAPRAVSAFNLFQTPHDIAEEMARRIQKHGSHGGRILEPSAGLGRLYRHIRQHTENPGPIVLVEESADCARELYAMTHDDPRVVLKQADFLNMQAADLGGPFDAICMNPPFKQGRDVKHIRHAAGMLAPGGLLVALCYDGARQNRDLRPECNTWDPLEPGAFAREGTRAAVVMVTVTQAREE